MSDDLVKRLRDGDHFEKVMSAEQAADRIEELEAALKNIRDVAEISEGTQWYAMIADKALTGGRDDKA